MKRPRYVPRPVTIQAAQCFQSAEEAWFWFIRAQRARREGLRHAGSGLMVRPCESDDVYLAAVHLMRAGVIGKAHLRVLLTYGGKDRPPDPRVRDEAWAARLWDEALDRMTTVLRRKGIVE